MLVLLKCHRGCLFSDWGLSVSPALASHLLYLPCPDRIGRRKAKLALREMLTVCLGPSERQIVKGVKKFQVTRESRVFLGRQRQKAGKKRKGRGSRGNGRCLVKVPRASGQTQTRQGDGHLGISSCPQGSLNKAVELGGKWLGGDEELSRCLCWLCPCVYFCVRLYFWLYAFLWWQGGGVVCLNKPCLNLCIFVCLSLCENVPG